MAEVLKYGIIIVPSFSVRNNQLFLFFDICQGMRDESNLVNMTSVEEDAVALYEAGKTMIYPYTQF